MRRQPVTRTLSQDEIRRLTRRLFLGLVAAGAAPALIFGGLTAYAGMWPPILVVESGSMQHSDTTSEIGVLDTGDLAVIQTVHSVADIVTYVQGRASGYTSFGDYGDVIAFADPEPNETAVLIHRTFAYAVRNASGGFDVPQLAGLPASDWWGAAADGTNTTRPFHLRAFTLTKMGWGHNLTIAWDLNAAGANYSNDGFLTFGDHNLYRTAKRTDPWILPDTYVLARARGEIPWVGLLRLTLIRSPEGCCAGWGSTDPDVGAPANSWVALDVLLIVCVAGPVSLDLALRRLRLRRWLRGRLAKVKDKNAAAVSPMRGGAGRHDAISDLGPSSGSEAFARWMEGIEARIERIRGSATPEKKPENAR